MSQTPQSAMYKGEAIAQVVNSSLKGEAFSQDVVHLLQRYAAGVEELLTDSIRDGAAATGQARTISSSSLDGVGNLRSPRSSGNSRGKKFGKGTPAVQRLRDDGVRSARAAEIYRQLLSTEHERWVAGREELLELYLEARRQELEVARRYYNDKSLEVDITKRCEMHVAAIKPHEDVSSQDQVSKAQSDWSGEVCGQVLHDLRLDWQSNQKRILHALTRELRHEYAAVSDVLDKHHSAWEELKKFSDSAWEKELMRAQDQLDRLAAGFRKALQVLCEAELREVKQHVAEQKEFFKSDIRDAQQTEKIQDARNGAQIRRMRLAVLKWQHDYARDAQTRARERASRRLMEVGVEEQSVQDSATQQTLSGGRRILEQIHERLPVHEAEVREFLHRLEAAAPSTPEVLRLYEEHLAEHGVLAPLGTAAAVRAPTLKEEPKSPLEKTAPAGRRSC